MNKFEEITRARTLLGLPGQATRKKVRTTYRKLIKKWHPDRCKSDNAEHCKEMTIKINAAYKLISAYCDQYEIPFSPEEVKKYVSEEEWWLERFGNDPLWGKGN